MKTSFASFMVLAAIAFNLIVSSPPSIAGDAPGDSEKNLEIYSTEPFATDPFEPGLNWRLSDDAESLVVERFGEPVYQHVSEVWSRNPRITLQETRLLYADMEIILVGQVGSKTKRIRQIRVFGTAVSLKHSIRIGMDPSDLKSALDLADDPSIGPSPIRIDADYEEYDIENDFSARMRSVFEAHVGLGTIQFMRWEFLQD